MGRETASCRLCEHIVCGDGVIGFGEACDDGNNSDEDDCFACQPTRCGDGAVTSLLDEQCDDGNLVDSDGCTGRCVTEVCGDGIVQSALATRDGRAAAETCDSTPGCEGPSGTGVGGCMNVAILRNAGGDDLLLSAKVKVSTEPFDFLDLQAGFEAGAPSVFSLSDEHVRGHVPITTPRGGLGTNSVLALCELSDRAPLDTVIVGPDELAIDFRDDNVAGTERRRYTLSPGSAGKGAACGRYLGGPATDLLFVRSGTLSDPRTTISVALDVHEERDQLHLLEAHIDEVVDEVIAVRRGGDEVFFLVEGALRRWHPATRALDGPLVEFDEPIVAVDAVAEPGAGDAIWVLLLSGSVRRLDPDGSVVEVAVIPSAVEFAVWDGDADTEGDLAVITDDDLFMALSSLGYVTLGPVPMPRRPLMIAGNSSVALADRRTLSLLSRETFHFVRYSLLDEL